MASRATELAEAIASVDRQSLDAAMRAKARLCLIDFLGCAFEASALEPSRQAVASVYEAPGGHIIGEARTATPADAAFVNAVKGHGLVREDMHAASVCHHGVVIWPLLLAFAESGRVTGSSLLEAAIIAYEVGGRLGRMLVDGAVSALFRPTGLVGPIAAATGGAILTRLDPAATASTLAFAANTASGLNEWPSSGASDMFFHPGFAARNAVTAVRLGAAGGFGSPEILEGAAGYFAAFARRPMPGAVELFPRGEAEIFSVYHKSAPACNFAQTACQTALRLIEMIGANAAPVRQLRISVPAAAAAYPGCDHQGPFERALQAKMSIPFGVAAVLVNGRLDEANYADLANPEVLRLAAVAELSAGPELTARFPSQQGAVIELVLADERRLSIGLPDLIPATEAEVRARFRQAAGAMLGQDRADAIEGFIDTIESSRDCGRLMQLCALDGAASARLKPTSSV